MYTNAIVLILSCIILVGNAAIVPGGYQKISVDDTDLRTALNIVERQLDNRGNWPNVHRVQNIRQANRQIVSGVKYSVQFDFGETDCLKSEIEDDVSFCNFSGKTLLCSADIVAQKWIKQYRVIEFHCD